MLLPLLGCTWILGLFAVDENTTLFLFIFALLNSLQGLFVVWFHFVMNSEVRSALRRKYDQWAAQKETLTTGLSTDKQNKTDAISMTEKDTKSLTVPAANAEEAEHKERENITVTVERDSMGLSTSPNCAGIEATSFPHVPSVSN